MMLLLLPYHTFASFAFSGRLCFGEGLRDFDGGISDDKLGSGGTVYQVIPSAMEFQRIKGQQSIRNLAMHSAFRQWLYELSSRSKDLKLIVFGGTKHDPFVILVEVKVADAVREASMHVEPVGLLVLAN
jgi:hypothetical protein